MVPVVLPARQPDHWVHHVGGVPATGRLLEDDRHGCPAAPSLFGDSSSGAVEYVLVGRRVCQLAVFHAELVLVNCSDVILCFFRLSMSL